MTPLSQSGAAFGASDPNAILNECRDIGVEIGRVDDNLSQLRMLHDRSLNETDGGSSVTKNQLDELSAATMAMNQDLVMRVRQIKSKPEGQSAKNKPHVDRVERRLRDAMQQYQQVESQFRHKMQDQMERQYRIVRPDATDDEVQAAVEDMSVGGQQVFQQAMMQSGRQGQARAVLDAVKNRHQALLKIEQDMQTITDLFTDLSTLIEQQEPMVEKIDQNGEEAVVDIIKGNEELDVAVETARSTRKKKWICLGICGKSHNFEHGLQFPKAWTNNVSDLQSSLSLSLSLLWSYTTSSPTLHRVAVAALPPPPSRSVTWFSLPASGPYPRYTPNPRSSKSLG